jgi:predicted nucleic acid-binding protein
VRLVFADTLYWGAVLHPLDQYRAQVIRAREAAARAVRTILKDRRATVHPQSRESFLAGLRLYEQRSDKGHSLVDCISMTTMRRQRILEVLTNDRHFIQEGFKIVLL